MKPDGSVTTESFKPCQLLPEQWTPLAFNKLSELYIASKAQHAQEKVKLLKLHTQEMTAAAAQHKQEMAAAAARHAQEMAAAAAQHKQEMAAAAARHAQEMAAVKREYNLEYLENLDLKFDGIDFDQLEFSGDTHM